MSKNNGDNTVFNGGIQNGTTAYDNHSLKLNALLTRAKKELQIELSPLGITMKPSLSALEIPGGLAGISPDGGIWFNQNQEIKVIVFEGKKQGTRGNAHERWYKNNAVIKYLFPNNHKYITFCVGKGVLPSSTLYKGFGFALAIEGKGVDSWNTLHRNGVSFYSSENGFDFDSIKDIMRKAILGDSK